MKQRSFFSILLIGVVTLLTLSGVIFYQLWSHTPLNLLQGGPMSNPTATMFIGKNSPLMVSLLVNPDRLDALQQVLASPNKRGRSHQEFSQIVHSFVAQTDFQYERDFQSWLGNEVTFAVTNLDVDRDGENGQQRGFLFVLSSKNSQRSQDFLELYWQKHIVAGENVIFEPYKGVKIIYQKGEAFPGLATAIVKGITPRGKSQSFVLLANHPQVLRNAINQVQATHLNLNYLPEYEQTLSQLSGGKVGLMYVNFSQLIQGLKPLDSAEVETALLSSTDSVLTTTFAVNPHGLLAKSAWLNPVETSSLSLLKEPVGALKYIPVSSPFVLGSQNLDQLWREISQTVAQNEFLQHLITQTVVDLEKTWGVNLPDQIFAWVQEDYALGLIPNSEGKLGDWIFVAKPSERSETGITQLKEIAQKQGYSLGSFNLEDYEVNAWTKLTTIPGKKVKRSPKKTAKIKAEARVVYGKIDEYDVFTSSVESMGEVLGSLKKNSILDQADFRESLEVLPSPNQGYLYLDWEHSHQFWERQIPLLRLLEFSARPLFNHLHSLSFTSGEKKDQIQQASILFRLR